MYVPPDRPALECQACGTVLQALTDEQAADVALNPYNYIAFCAPCKRKGYHIEPGFQ
ncbi:hypothetical protein L3Y21_gp083 [Gordonia phage Rabbitrun]|uniref:Uncharacterized protein n=1 Tax=Gordonia phage Rabbitrun TaxID=2762280 RepID=A0A7G8LIQ2_9CAUD|nr:hypothetical protein L3Y21_gp083 [Gordonia phage Rabbitrun]QNJ57124.1 hypothetical protein SEA_RABBITRUN_83 [Gordonia phage Rabbitrun]